MNATILQIPMKEELRIKAIKVAEKQGFSSLQEAIRVFLNQLAENKIQVFFAPSPISLSPKNDQHYAQMIAEVRAGKVKSKSFSDVDKLMNYLNK